MVFVYAMPHNMDDNKLEDVGLSLTAENERSGKQRLYQHRARNRQSETFFQGRHKLWDRGEGDVPPLLAVAWGYKGYIDVGDTMGYMKISTCYELSLHVDNNPVIT